MGELFSIFFINNNSETYTYAYDGGEEDIGGNQIYVTLPVDFYSSVIRHSFRLIYNWLLLVEHESRPVKAPILDSNKVASLFGVLNSPNRNLDEQPRANAFGHSLVKTDD